MNADQGMIEAAQSSMAHARTFLILFGIKKGTIQERDEVAFIN
jgi:hypothetical protein